MWIVLASLAWADDKLDRDSAEGVTDAVASENFVVKWGAGGDPSTADVDALLDGLERAWTVEFDTLGFTKPLASDTYRINVYLANTGLTLAGMGEVVVEPPIAAAALPDLEGYPIMLVPDYQLGAANLDVSTAHELFHLSQFGSLLYPGDDHLWWWEATAVWAQQTVHEDTGAGLWALHFLPHLAIEHTLPLPDPSNQEEFAEFVRMYGLYTFPYFLEAQYGPDIVRDVWADDNGLSPLDRLEEVLESEYGVALDPAVHAWSVAKATWDDDALAIDAEAIEAEWLGHLEASGADPSLRDVLDHHIAMTVTGDGADHAPPDALRPGRYGSNHVVLEAPARDRVVVELDGATTGTEGTPARWLATALALDSEGSVLSEVPLEDGVAVVEDARDADRILVVVTAASDSFVDGEVYDYTIRMDERRARLCDTTAGPASSVALAAVFVVALRRRKEER
jgi:hypothetical protein